MAVFKDELRTVLTSQDKASATLKKVKSQTDKTTEGFSKLGTLFTTGAIAVGFAKFGGLAEVQAQALSRLKTAVRNTGEDYAGLEEDVLSVTSALQKKTTFGDEEQLAALAELTTVTGSYQTALASLPLVLDVAAQKGLGLRGAAKLLARGISGDTEVFTRFGKEVKTLIENEAGLDKILAVVQKSVKGQAEAMGNVSPLTQFKNNVGDIGEEIGKGLLPLVKGLNSIVTELGSTFIAQEAGVIIFALAIPKVVTGIKALNIAMVKANVLSKKNLFTVLGLAAATTIPLILKVRDAEKKAREQLENSDKIAKDAIDNQKKLIEFAKQKQIQLDAEEKALKDKETLEKSLADAQAARLQAELDAKKLLADQEIQIQDLVNANIISGIKGRFEKQRALASRNFSRLIQDAGTNSDLILVIKEAEQSKFEEIETEEVAFKKDQNAILLQLQIDAGLISVSKQKEILELKLEQERTAIELQKEMNGEASIETLIREQELQNELLAIDKAANDKKTAGDQSVKKAKEQMAGDNTLFAARLAIKATSLNKNASLANFRISQAAALAEAGVITALNYLKALALPPLTGVNFAAAGLSLAAGGLQAGIIASQKPPSFQTRPGEVLRVPGPDNLPVAAIVHGGEDIGRPAPSSGNINISFNGDVLNGEETMTKIQEGLVDLELQTGRKAVL